MVRLPKKLKGYLIVICGGFLMAIADIIIKNLLDTHIDLFFMVAVRDLFGFLLLLLFVCFSKPQLLIVDYHNLPNLMVYGIGGIALLHLFGILSVQKNDVSIGITILYTSPLFILGYTVFLRQPIHFYEILTALVILSGLVLTFRVYNIASFISHGAGLLVGCGAAALFAFSTLWGQKCIRRLNPLTVAVYGMGFGSLFWLITGWIAGFNTWEYPLETWAQLGAIAFFATLFIPIFYLLGLRWISPAEANLTASLEAVFAVGLSCAVFKEHLDGVQWVGLGLIIFGVGYLQLKSIT